MRLSWLKQRWILVFTLVLLAAVVPYLISRLASPGRCVVVRSTALSTGPTEPASQLRVIGYNIAHGRGLAKSNWSGGDRATRRARLSSIAELLVKLDADIVVLNEVDFDSSWSGHVNQAELIAELAGYPHWVEQRNLDFRVLGWTWRFGNAVLSKWPITNAELVDLPGYASWESVIVGQKRAAACELRVGEQTIRVIGAHLSHRSETVRVQSAQRLVALVRESDYPTIVAGDLNSTPQDFPGSKVDPEGRNAIGVLDASGLFRRSPAELPQSTKAFTFRADAPNQVIDWVLIPSKWRFAEYRVVPSTLSDHRPIVAEVTWSERSNGEQ